MKERIFFPNLDGLRTIAFLAVFFVHSFYTPITQIHHSSIYQAVKLFFSGGALGVNLFFVLSGFLITYLLIHEENLRSHINLPNFYVRRFLRIWPLYFLCVSYGFIIEPRIMDFLGKQCQETASPVLYASFLSNFSNIIYGEPEAQNLPVLWSVSIEEQFYLLWPLLLIFFRKSRPLLCYILIAVSLIFNYFNLYHNHIMGIHTLSVVSDLAIGGFIAIVSYHSSSFVDFFKNLKTWQIFLVYVLGIIIIVFRKDLFRSELLTAIQRLAISCFFAFVILEQNYASNSFFKLGESRIFSSLGKYTYSLYCLHMIGITFAKEACTLLKINQSLWGVILWQTLLGLTITLLMGYFSYEYFEKHFLKMKEKFSFITH